MTETRPVSEDAPNPSANQNPVSGSSTAHLALVPTWLPLDVTGSANYNSAGSGGGGVAMGVISSSPMAVFMPSNAAIAAPNSAANAHQGNNALINQHPTEVAGMGGDGGIGNVAVGGGDSANHAGSGGNGVFYGGMVNSDVGVFAPINTAVAGGPGSSEFQIKRIMRPCCRAPPRSAVLGAQAGLTTRRSMVSEAGTLSPVICMRPRRQRSIRREHG